MARGALLRVDRRALRGVPLPGGKPVRRQDADVQAAISRYRWACRDWACARQPKLTAKIDRAAVNLCVDMAYRPALLIAQLVTPL